MKPIVVLRHVPHEGLGILDQIFRQGGLVYATIDLFRGEVPRSFRPEQLAGLIVLGGPMNVDQTGRYPFLAAEIGWIRQAVDWGLPTLGICLGSQLLAKALGAKVYAHRVKEIGWSQVQIEPEAADDPLFSIAQPVETVFQWHGDTFDLPAGAVRLASNAICANQAFRYGSKAWGLQFHMEVTAAMIEEWLTEPGNCGELEGLDYVHPEEIRTRTPDALPGMMASGSRIFERFASLCRNRC